MKKIFVLMGGCSNEREVSLVSGRNVADALRGTGRYEVVDVDLRTDSLAGLDLAGACAVYIALHGGWGESGGVQAALNALKVPYTGPGARASRIAMDKIETKKVLDAAGVPNARWCVYKEASDGRVVTPDGSTTLATDARSPLATDARSPFGYPCVVKVPRDGSSVGVYLVKDDAGFRQALLDCWRIDGHGEALVEAFLPGREMTVGVIGGTALPVIEIVAKGGWYGYEEKYHSDETRYPFLEEEPLASELQRVALDAFHAVGCRGVTRVDFRVTPDGRPYVLELNTSPGFTGHSLVPKAGMKTGLTFAEVCEKILATADYDHE